MESEEAIEQTSLQCNVSVFPLEKICDWGISFALGVDWCEGDVSKGGVFGDDVCSQKINAEWDCVVALS